MKKPFWIGSNAIIWT